MFVFLGVSPASPVALLLGREVVVPKSPSTTAVVPLAIVDPSKTPPDGMVKDSRIPEEPDRGDEDAPEPLPSRLPIKLETNCDNGREKDCTSYVPVASPRAPIPRPNAVTPRLTR